MFLGAQKNSPIEMILLSAHNYVLFKNEEKQFSITPSYYETRDQLKIQMYKK